MSAHGVPSPVTQPAVKRLRQPSSDGRRRRRSASPMEDHGRAGQSSNFRNVSACNRCRLRKNRCDQRLPSCGSCAKADVACVGYDPITKREIPRSAIVHLESCLSFRGGGHEVLQAVLLLANFALLRPTVEAILFWSTRAKPLTARLLPRYITGVAVRLAVDLGLHHEDHDDGQDGWTGGQDGGCRRLWTRDMRRRLWWCTYSLDRLVSTCVGRPFGISDQVITTELPSLLDDDCLTPFGFVSVSEGEGLPSYKRVAHHYFRLRMLQSEMLEVLSYNQAQRERADGHRRRRRHRRLLPRLPSPFLVQFDSFRAWRRHMDDRLLEWKNSAPTRRETGVAFSTEFLELNYWQAIVMLYRHSLSVPVMFEGEYNTSDEMDSPTAYTAELREDEDHIYVKVAEAGQRIVRIYRQLHLDGLVSYTYLSTHHLFMAGISYLYAIWHSSVVRAGLSMDEVDFTVLAAKSVFTDMIDKCPPAETCRDAFDRTAKATIKMASSMGGFGRQHGRDATGWTVDVQQPRQPHQMAGSFRFSSPAEWQTKPAEAMCEREGPSMAPAPHYGVALPPSTDLGDECLRGVGDGGEPALDFCINWEGGRDDEFGDGQQMNPFDAFFFGGGGGGGMNL
ncbi:hypothetical protein CP532_1228 [Ophiocordyceps camponoti-leonardi (nom. inval.)]|nr:hypothetical protein CP532_1228 [Ophiocordyceps camponoti-leonardi (nom. inval.)]